MDDIFQPCIGIIGGMGPLAGVELQRLIIEATPARSDQDHLRVLCFTDPTVPDRTASLQQNGGVSYVRAVCTAAQMLERAGATILVMACNTAHARFDYVQRAVSIPVLHLVEEAAQSITEPIGSPIGVFATDGTLASKVFEEKLDKRGYLQMRPSVENQRMVMKLIYGLKAGSIQPNEAASKLVQLIEDWRDSGVQTVILGCTELSLCFEMVNSRTSSIIVDPLRVAAGALVRIAKESTKRLQTQRTMCLN